MLCIPIAHKYLCNTLRFPDPKIVVIALPKYVVQKAQIVTAPRAFKASASPVTLLLVFFRLSVLGIVIPVPLIFQYYLPLLTLFPAPFLVTIITV